MFRDFKQTDKSKETSTNNGGSTDYYDLEEEWTSLQDIIEGKEMPWNIANIFKSCYRLGKQDHSTVERDLNKIKYFIDREIERVNKHNIKLNML